MDDEVLVGPPETSMLSSSSNIGGTFHTVISNSTSGDITMIGCKTTSNFVLTAAQTLPSDFRRIHFGDIDLRQELRVDYAKMVVHKRAFGPQVYSARVHGGESTVALYRGDRAEEEWKRGFKKYASLRHPNIIQLWGVASAGDIHALLFHGVDLIPFQQYVNHYRHSRPRVPVYIYASCSPEFMAASEYIHSASRKHLLEKKSTFWIRRSTSQLCVELVQPNDPIDLGSWRLVDISKGAHSLIESHMEDTLTKSLSLEDYHHICWFHLAQYREISGSLSSSVNLGAIIYCSLSNKLDESVEIVSLPDMEVVRYPWSVGRVIGEAMEDGWTRFDCGDVLNNKPRLYRSIYPTSVRPWLSQANHTFERLGITSNFDSYVFVLRADFCLNISGNMEPVAGFLFLCPVEDFQTGPSSFSCPKCPAYWSLDPAGVERLSMEKAIQLGFPSFQLTTEIQGRCWDASVYDGLRQFHHAKGYAPESQDVALHLGHSLYQSFKITTHPAPAMRLIEKTSLKEAEQVAHANPNVHRKYCRADSFIKAVSNALETAKAAMDTAAKLLEETGGISA
ncbi:hypothetical protein MVEN_00142600 [Mycena venus]|uniref:Protein kinase domain-containing protein n=1 Tax=Mycena venus TaxID=2733690 RepID=A0A8H6Z079_9AGAR|nr:hypothetical protein MVEN_00142600 [Mycena venus]